MLILIRVNLRATYLRWLSKFIFQWILTPLKLFVEPFGTTGDEKATLGYELEIGFRFCLVSALSQNVDEESDLEKCTCAAEQ